MNAFDLVLTRLGLRFQGQTLPCSVGRGGVSTRKREGDGATPAGTLRIVGMMYRPDRVASPARWAVPIGPGDLWSDDPWDAAYNLPVRAPYHRSHEGLRRADPLYDLILITDWNYPDAIAGLGSAIFLHQWRRPGYPTEGCVALARRHLHQIAGQIQPGTRLIIPAF
ncbi:MAG: L,D-transpeptidase family protein [Pseudomonadota bacterium]